VKPDRGLAAGIVLAVLIGAGVAIQSRVNGELGTRLHDGIAAAALSVGGGLVLLALLVPALPAGRRGLAALRVALRDGKLRWWQCTGGVCGALYVVSQGVTATALGVAVFTVAIVAGQSASGLLMDRAGIGPAGRHALTGTRVVGAALSVVAVLVAVSGQFGTPKALALAVLPALAGAGGSWQTAVNGQVRAHAGAALPAAFVNFAAGCTSLLIALTVDLAVRGRPALLPRTGWLYLGGGMGVVFIAVAVAIVHRTGVLLLGLGTIAGQLAGAVAIDEFVPGRHPRPGAPALAGIALTLLAVGIAVLPRRRHAQL
jgi:bacterial/archaeal transporter family-2 protein